ncbi:hypothetical protein WA158_001557 [Blastocystis sp. Blastoise]
MKRQDTIDPFTKYDREIYQMHPAERMESLSSTKPVRSNSEDVETHFAVKEPDNNVHDESFTNVIDTLTFGQSRERSNSATSFDSTKTEIIQDFEHLESDVTPQYYSNEQRIRTMTPDCTLVESIVMKQYSSVGSIGEIIRQMDLTVPLSQEEMKCQECIDIAVPSVQSILLESVYIWPFHSYFVRHKRKSRNSNDLTIHLSSQSDQNNVFLSLNTPIEREHSGTSSDDFDFIKSPLVERLEQSTNKKSNIKFDQENNYKSNLSSRTVTSFQIKSIDSIASSILNTTPILSDDEQLKLVDSQDDMDSKLKKLIENATIYANQDMKWNTDIDVVSFYANSFLSFEAQSSQIMIFSSINIKECHLIFVLYNSSTLFDDNITKQYKYMILFLSPSLSSSSYIPIYDTIVSIFATDSLYIELYSENDSKIVCTKLLNQLSHLQQNIIITQIATSIGSPSVSRGLLHNWWQRGKQEYIQDFKDIRHIQILYDIIGTFFGDIIPTIITGMVLMSGTQEHISYIEMFLSTSIAFIYWSICGGQPIILLGTSGLVALFIGAIYSMTVTLSVPFFPFYFWCGLWCSIILFLFVFIDGFNYLPSLTSFSNDIYISFTGTIFIINAFKYIIQIYKQSQDSNSFSSCLLSISIITGILTIINISKRIQAIPFLRWGIRTFCRLFSSITAIGITSCITSFFFPSIDYIPVSFHTLTEGYLYPSYKDRSWIINPFFYNYQMLHNIWIDRSTALTECPYETNRSIEEGCIFPFWAILVAVIPGFLFALFIITQEELTSDNIYKKQYKLKRGSSVKYWDLFSMGILLVILSLFEREPVYGDSIFTIIHVFENRISTLIIGGLFLLVTILSVDFHHIPEAALYGVLLDRGMNLYFTSAISKRIRLLFAEPIIYKVHPIIKQISRKSLFLFTVIQMILIFILYVLKLSSSLLLLLFPLGIALLFPIRLYLLPYLFQSNELNILDPPLC